MTGRRQSSVLLERLIRRIMRDETECARKLLASPTPSDATAIHETRKAVKRLRAALSLIRKELGPRYQEWIDRLRSVNRRLSSVRDLDASLKILHDLRPGCSFPQRVVIDQLQAELTEQRAACATAGEAGWRQPLIDDLDVVLEGFTDWQNTAEGFDLVRPALRDMAQRARRLIRRLREKPEVDTVHGLRKLVKWRLYWLEFLHPIWPRGLLAEQRLVDSLADRLGDYHDLAVLRQWMRQSVAAQQAADARSLQGFEQLLASQQKKLERRALKQARYLFAERPKAFARRWKALWKIWRGTPQAAEQSSPTVDLPLRPRPR